MKTISIKELHAATGKWVRAAKHEPIVVTDRGEQVAELRPLGQPRKAPAEFDVRARLKWMPKSAGDSTIYISEDRNGR